MLVPQMPGVVFWERGAPGNTGPRKTRNLEEREPNMKSTSNMDLTIAISPLSERNNNHPHTWFGVSIERMKEIKDLIVAEGIILDIQQDEGKKVDLPELWQRCSAECRTPSELLVLGMLCESFLAHQRSARMNKLIELILGKSAPL